MACRDRGDATPKKTSGPGDGVEEQPVQEGEQIDRPAAGISQSEGDGHDHGAGRRDSGNLAVIQGEPGTFLKFTHLPILHNFRPG